MSAMFGEKVPVGQANGPDVELIVRGTELYATYQTPDGYPAVYDDVLGLFCYARLADGAFQSTGAPVSGPPPPDTVRGAEESADTKKRKIASRTQQMDRRAHAPAGPNEKE